MGDNEFNQYSSASHRLSARLGFHLLGEAAAMYSRLYSPLYILSRGFGLKWQREHGSGWLRPPLFRSKVEPETFRDRRLWVGFNQRFQLALGIVQQTGLGV